MKKVIISFILLLTIVGMSLPTFAASDNTSNNATVVYDYEKKAYKTFQPGKIASANLSISSTQSDPWWAAHCDMYTDIGLPLTIVAKAYSDSYQDQAGTIRQAIDYIAAEVRYYIDQVLVNQNADDHTNASHAGCQVVGDFLVADHDAYGNHTFEEAGYVSWYPETYDGSY